MKLVRQIAVLFITSFAVLVTARTAFAQNLAPSGGEDFALVAFAQQAATRALNFHQGDTRALARAKADFTSEGWAAFMKHMEGWLDANGAPEFTSRFASTGAPILAGRENGELRLQIPGMLKQTHNQSSTTYRSYIEIVVGGKPFKVVHLEQITCGRRRTSCP